VGGDQLLVLIEGAAPLGEDGIERSRRSPESTTVTAARVVGWGGISPNSAVASCQTQPVQIRTMSGSRFSERVCSATIGDELVNHVGIWGGFGLCR
jgi:hypothetical protein